MPGGPSGRATAPRCGSARPCEADRRSASEGEPAVRHAVDRHRVGPDVKSKADSGRGPAPLLDTDAAQLRALDPPELAARDTYGGPGGVLADAGVAPSQSYLAANLMIELPELLEGSIQPAISSCHSLMVDAPSHPPITWEMVGNLRLAGPAQRLNRRRKERVRSPSMAPAAALRRRLTRQSGQAAGRPSVDPPGGSADAERQRLSER